MQNEFGASEQSHEYVSQNANALPPPRERAEQQASGPGGARPEGAEPAALNPTLQRLLTHCGFDRTWVHGAGAWLRDDSGRRFLDFYAQYGAVALGHNAAAVVAAVQAALGSGEPAMVQPYRAPYAERLAAELAQLSGLSHCFLSVSGAEVVEAAIKLVRARSSGQRTLILSAEGSYHGKTLGALAATGQPQYGQGFGPPLPGFAHFPFGDAAALKDCLIAHAGEVAGVILEPIQGERGVHVPPAGYLRAVRELCTQHDVALIMDEVQTGLGRTGQLLACQHEGVKPDLLLLAKALGGGLFPLAACLVAAPFWSEGFALRHSSTFANNNVACRVGLAVLKELVSGGLIEQAQKTGERLQRRLAPLVDRFPKSVRAVRGRGLFGAIELAPTASTDGYFLGYLSHQGLLAYGIAATLAEREGVLVLPSLGSGNILRLSPPLSIRADEIDRAMDAIEATLLLLERRDAVTIWRAMGGCGPRPLPQHAAPGRPLYLPLPTPPDPPRRRPTYAFIGHYLDKQATLCTDPTFVQLSEQELDRFHEFAAALPAGVVLQAPTVRSAQGAEADGFIIALPMLPEQMAKATRHRVKLALQRAVDLAFALGASVVGLGALTTPYSRRGVDVVGRGPLITTGNTLTAIMAVEALVAVAQAQGRQVGAQRVAVVGARGSVGGLCARLLAELLPGQLWLVGSPGSSPLSLHKLADELHASTQLPKERIGVTTDLGILAECELILTASGSPRPILDGAEISAGTVICDVARPFDCSQKLRSRPDITIIDGGLVSLPDPAMRFGVGNIADLPDGIQLACLSETILLTLCGASSDFGVGDSIDLATAREVRKLAREHGFLLASPCQDGQPQALKKEQVA